jgi:hypothetical protein
VGASILGYFVGKFSYADTCADKFLVEAPNSNIAQAIRKRRGIAPLENTEGVEVIPAPGRSDFFFTKVFGDGILGHQFMEFLDINLSKDSSLLLHAIHSPIYGRIFKKTIFHLCFS